MDRTFPIPSGGLKYFATKAFHLPNTYRQKGPSQYRTMGLWWVNTTAYGNETVTVTVMEGAEELWGPPVVALTFTDDDI